MLNPRLISVVARILDVPVTSLTPETGIGDLDAWDSLGHLRLMMELEHIFQIRFSTAQIRELTSLIEIQNVLPIEDE